MYNNGNIRSKSRSVNVARPTKNRWWYNSRTPTATTATKPLYHNDANPVGHLLKYSGTMYMVRI